MRALPNLSFETEWLEIPCSTVRLDGRIFATVMILPEGVITQIGVGGPLRFHADETEALQHLTAEARKCAPNLSVVAS